ncbi:outer membrane lipoprotein carrier protein LolA [Bosea caraganae]|uniref:Outer membrane lipoprotein carrier protein LolA n=1 Tax=Bosea caraganae TaxID=2763117 RepID=A0A370L850_9HYPH|nr:outer membrane lipoprotein carrier protein LolA [Bosea caraganae]RDJ25221.1 outer membrane lipoprotein carrier protein LolA [Bosea caraganae]RDJ26331.1 outer membrane lipoprotein carrier protein LolA [Bosea caraganae]
MGHSSTGPRASGLQFCGDALRPIACALTLSFLALLLQALPSQAQSTTLQEGQILRGQFEQKRYLSGLDNPVRSSGVFTLVAGKGLIWTTKRPFATVTVMTEAGLVQDVKGKETLRLSASKLPVMAKLYTMFGAALTGNWDAMQGAFTLTRQQNGQAWTIHLESLRADDPNLPIKAIKARGQKLLDEVEVVKTNDDRDVLTFSNQKLEAGRLTPEEEEFLVRAQR